MSEFTPGVRRTAQMLRAERNLKITWFTAGLCVGVAYMLVLLLVLTRIY